LNKIVSSNVLHAYLIVSLFAWGIGKRNFVELRIFLALSFRFSLERNTGLVKLFGSLCDFVYMVVTQDSLIVFIVKKHTHMYSFICSNWNSLCNSRLNFRNNKNVVFEALRHGQFSTYNVNWLGKSSSMWWVLVTRMRIKI
jgi:hypothetical protein